MKFSSGTGPIIHDRHRIPEEQAVVSRTAGDETN